MYHLSTSPRVHVYAHDQYFYYSDWQRSWLLILPGTVLLQILTLLWCWYVCCGTYFGFHCYNLHNILLITIVFWGGGQITPQILPPGWEVSSLGFHDIWPSFGLLAGGGGRGVGQRKDRLFHAKVVVVYPQLPPFVSSYVTLTIIIPLLRGLEFSE